MALLLISVIAIFQDSFIFQISYHDNYIWYLCKMQYPKYIILVYFFGI